MEREVNETLATFLTRIENAEVIPEDGIILGRNVKMPVLLDGVDNQIVKTPIAFSLVSYGMFYIVETPAGYVVPKHHHDESILRILIKGDLTINGKEIGIGEWFVVLAGTKYSIETKGGYTSMAAYTSNCRTNRMSHLHLERTPE
jgi:hypothetical protein